MSAQGKCLGKGTFDEMSTSGIDFSSLLQTNEEEEEKKKPPAVVYERATSVEHAHSSLQNIGSTFSLTSIGTEFEVRSESSIFSESSFGEQCSNLSLNLFMIVSLNKKISGFILCTVYLFTNLMLYHSMILEIHCMKAFKISCVIHMYYFECGLFFL